ncbi:MAG: MBOAT family protein [Ignavibacteria bacterium]|jgi:D-alanyl-lipoteichoic acid acyltransferase DltB (MBOAT superfamily)|nr:MBOAT family protein [Ignavibacteria bacterium]
MLFNSFDFAVFLPIVFLLYWLVFNRNITARNVFLLSASYVFYGFWNPKFLILIVISSVVDYFIALAIHNTGDNAKKRKLMLLVSVLVNMGFLGFFKYYNFFVESFVDVFTLFGQHFDYSPLNIILPVGISFYTFQSLSYTIDVYKKEMEPTRNILDFMTFVAFFPQLVAGPIERAKKLLPQFSEPKKFDYENARSGVFMILLGLFKKMMIADRVAVFVNGAYANPAEASGFSLVLAAVFFAFQLYLDFSAYSDIAIGTAKLFNFKLSVNFNKPYLSASFSEFWTRWHISLSSWFRDYVYIPLGGNRRGKTRKMINLMIIFLISGLWHGASWNFVIWGALNGIFVLLFDSLFHLEKSGKTTKIKRIIAPIFVTLAWTFSCIFFRIHTLADALLVVKSLSLQGIDKIYGYGLNGVEIVFSLGLIALLMIYEIIVEKYDTMLTTSFFNGYSVVRWAVCIIGILSIIFLGAYGAGNDNTFIYFQF